MLEIKENKLIMGFKSIPPCPPSLFFSFGLMTFGGKFTSRTGAQTHTVVKRGRFPFPELNGTVRSGRL